MNLYLKYRPTTLEEIRGNSEMIGVLQEMLTDKENCPHVFLFHGPTGCGKTTIGRVVANRLGCTRRDFREVNSADFRGIDTIREINKQSCFRPLGGSCRAWLIDECHKLTNDAQNALLKILEDTPPHVYFILCTTKPQNLIPEIKGRCTQYQVQPLNERQMLGLLRSVVKAENENVQKIVFEQIIQNSSGYPRNALQILDQVLRVDDDKRLEMARHSAEEQSQSIELCRALFKKTGWKFTRNILNGLKEEDPEGIRRHVLKYAQVVLLGETDEETRFQAGLILEMFIDPFWNSGFPGLVYACYSIVKN